MALFAVARNGSSILNEAQSDELTTFYKYITQRMKIEYENETVYYKSGLCEPFCEFNAQLWNILVGFLSWNIPVNITKWGK
ncbi:unnamed protein product [Anisakis simplex]|uniref:Uncharacterized protein n=1 Tax=Anisakis simplex TaxID=6269 RepID=A0A0M3JG62_ANISI|nr:unnamed protein product [Anisakis simplex]